MKTRRAFASALKELRKSRGLTQEDFSLISSRTYISILERGLKSPTLEKIEAIAEILKVHPLTLLSLTYMKTRKSINVEDIYRTVRGEMNELID